MSRNRPKFLKKTDPDDLHSTRWHAKTITKFVNKPGASLTKADQQVVHAARNTLAQDGHRKTAKRKRKATQASKRKNR